MPFNSYEFIFIFMPATVTGFWLLSNFFGRTAAVGWLILASIGFYVYASLTSFLIIIPSILLDYVIVSALLRIDSTKERLRTFLFVAGISANVFFLGYFKYKNFFLDTANTLFTTNFELTKLILPLGISFLTFQKIALLVDVHSGQVQSVKLLDFLLFTLFFPRTVAGPIVHYAEVMPQFAETKLRNFSTNVAVGFCLFSVGLFKKAAIADSVAQFATPAFAPPILLAGQPLGLIPAWTGVLAYTFELYFDFSGYSDMALGVARTFGIRLPMNFNSPLKASSIVEFWNRWHITLTRFLTAYIYTPLVLSMMRARIAKGKTVLRGKRSTLSTIAVLVGLPTLITMAISGFWHGAGWQFIVWGGLHGMYLTINQSWRILRPRFWHDQASYERVMKPLGFVLTFTAVVVALVFFRANSITSAWSILRDMAGLNGIFAHDVQILHEVGISFDWKTLSWLLQPITQFVWIVALFLAVTLLPNSHELLRRFQPSLDFDALESRAPEPSAMQQGTGGKKPSAATRFDSLWIGLRQLRVTGISLDRLSATIAALLCVLGVMALNRGSAFLYGQF